jgi:hypothetical protein
MQNLTPADVYFGKGQTILLERERIKRKNVWRQHSVVGVGLDYVVFDRASFRAALGTRFDVEIRRGRLLSRIRR